jgi:co-chaperonin GroES (HSP10)|tara:strand:+ start:1610 stop:1867 length:258 start_codon:yes stop_codon:yes gene_type:complete
MKPINKYIAIDIIEEEIVTDSGLILSDKDADALRYKKAKVIAPGTEVHNISKGDVIYFDSRTGYTLLIDNKPCTIISERDVVVVL